VQDILQKNFVIKSIDKAGLSEAEFNQIIDSFKDFWKPIIATKYQKNLIIKGEWKKQDVDAFATRDDENNPVIVIQGGLGRHRHMNQNGLYLILCHELGHHYGGAPKSFRGSSKRRSWSSAEGQADYFATNKCMTRMIDESLIFSSPLNKVEKNHLDSCLDKYCLNILPAALSVGKLFASLKEDWREPSIKLKSESKVYRTFYQHSDPQCRFDTFIAGSLCSSEYDTDFDNEDHRVGACLNDLNPEASRPKCWFSSTDY
jgi:hypothetical protein